MAGAAALIAGAGLASCGGEAKPRMPLEVFPPPPPPPPPNVAPMAVGSMPPVSVPVGSSRAVNVSAYFTDPNGDPLAYSAASSDPATVSVTVSRDVVTVTGIAAGAASVTVTAKDQRLLAATQSFAATSALQSVTIAEVSPEVLLEGGEAYISGSGFSNVHGNNSVLVGGLPATVNHAGPNALRVTVPRTDCLPPRRVRLSVAVADSSAAVGVAVSPYRLEEVGLAPGSYAYSPAGDPCLHLPGDEDGGEYIIGITSTSEIPSDLTPLRLTSLFADTTVVLPGRPARAGAGETPRPRVVQMSDPAGASRFRLPAAGAGGAGGAYPLGVRTGRGRDGDRERHSRLMEDNWALLRRLGRARTGQTPTPAAALRTAGQTAGTLAVNDTLTLFAGYQTTCDEREQVRAVVRHDGEQTVWLEDLANPSESFSQSELAALDSFYATRVKSVHEEYFGTLSDVDENGDKVLVLITKEANRAQVGGWVWFGDLVNPALCGTSNHAEITFFSAPDPDGTYGARRSRQSLLDRYPVLLTHEIAHLIQARAWREADAGYDTWETEGGASFAEQLVAYRLYGHDSGRNLGAAAFAAGVDWYADWAAGMARFFGWEGGGGAGNGRVPFAPEQCSWLGWPRQGNDGPCAAAVRAPYDVPSMLYRYALDRWGGSQRGGESAVMTRLTLARQRGFEALEAVSGWPIEQVLADFYLTLILEFGGQDAPGMTSWDLADVWGDFPEPAHLRPYASGVAKLDEEWSVRAGSNVYLHWTPEGRRGLTSLRAAPQVSGTGARSLSLWAYRVR